MKIEDFRKLPNLEGFTISTLRLNEKESEVLGMVLIDKEGKKRYILRFNKIFVEDYW